MYKKLIAGLVSLILVFPVAILASDELILGGNSVGIVVNYDGVLISGTYRVEMNGQSFNPTDQDIQKGDMIIKADGSEIHSLEDLYSILKQHQKDINEIPLEIMRNDAVIKKTLISIYDQSSGAFQCGLYVKDEILGIGTMTFYNPQDQKFGALGHEIMDADFNKRADVNDGKLYNSDVSSITKGQQGVAGEKHANIDYNKVIANLKKNTEIGIYGDYQNLPQEVISLPWAKQDQIKTGKAEIYTVLAGKEIKAYSINITKLNHQTQSEVKGIEFIVDDPELLNKTNGIIQGMSGSPIVQNGHIIGAVTHVVTSDPSKGFGVYIEWMLEESK